MLGDDAAREYTLWHRRMGHLEPKKLKNLHIVARGLEKPIPCKHKKDPCDDCEAANKKNHNRPSSNSQRATRCLERIFMNICDPFDEGTDECRYFLMIIDDYSRRSWAYPIKTKDQASAMLEQ